MAWRIGAEFTMMEKAIRAEWSGTRSFMPYGAGNNHNTWYACTMVDAEGREIPWVDRDGRELTTVEERYRPAHGQRFFLKGGGEPDFPFYEFQGPETLSIHELLERGYKLPLFAALSRMPELERKAIWGLMVGNEGKTKVPIMGAYTAAGFDPAKHRGAELRGRVEVGRLPSAGAPVLRPPGRAGARLEAHDEPEGLFASGDSLFASNCYGHACARGHYAGRHAAKYAAARGDVEIHEPQLEEIREMHYRPLGRDAGTSWPEVSFALSRLMQHHCGAFKTDELLTRGLAALDEQEAGPAAALTGRNPHDLIRIAEIRNILTTARLILHSSLARRANSRELYFTRLDFPRSIRRSGRSSSPFARPRTGSSTAGCRWTSTGACPTSTSGTTWTTSRP